MRRRSLLVAVGAALAGCGEATTPSPTATPSPSPTPTLPPDLRRTDGTLVVNVGNLTDGDLLLAKRGAIVRYETPASVEFSLVGSYREQLFRVVYEADGEAKLGANWRVGSPVPTCYVAPLLRDAETVEYRCYANAAYVDLLDRHAFVDRAHDDGPVPVEWSEYFPDQFRATFTRPVGDGRYAVTLANFRSDGSAPSEGLTGCSQVVDASTPTATPTDRSTATGSSN